MGPVLNFFRGTAKTGHQPKLHPEVPLGYLRQDDDGSQEIHIESALKMSTVSKKGTENGLQRFSRIHDVFIHICLLR